VFDIKKAISDNAALQTAPRVKRGTAGDVFVNWKDLRDDPIDGDQYFQKIDVNGDRQWSDGVRIDPVFDIDFSARFSAGDDGGLNVIWERGSFPEIDIFYQNITSNGSYGADSPVSISSESGYQFAPILIGNIQTGLFGVYTTWSLISIYTK
jgi:hypothetical protein